MPTLAITKSYSDGSVLTEQDLDNIRDDLTTFFNTTKIDATNIQDAAITGAKLASSVVDASTLQLTSSTLSIKDAGVTGAKLATSVADATTLEVSGGSIRIKDLGVTTAKLNDLAVTNAKIAATTISHTKMAYPGVDDTAAQDGLAESLEGSANTSSSAYQLIANTAITLVTAGRPVLLVIQPAETSDATNNYLQLETGAIADGRLRVAIFKEGAHLANWVLRLNTGSTGMLVAIPGTFTYIDDPAAGTQSYDVRIRTGAGSETATLSGCMLRAVEL